MPLNFKVRPNDSPFYLVPSGKYLIVTEAYIAGRNLSASSNDKFSIIKSEAELGVIPNSSDDSIVINGINDVTEKYESGQSPLFILGPGKYLTYRNYSETSSVLVNVRGFLVDDLNY